MHKPRLTLHIGHPKSGSTTLQSFLFENWEALAEQGFHMPTKGFGVASEKTPAGNTLQYLEKLNKPKDSTPIRKWIETILEQKNDPDLLISSEILAGYGFPKLFAQLQDAVCFHIIYYVRRQDKLLLSAWKQWALKRGLTLDQLIEQRINDEQPNFIGTTRRWHRAIPEATFHVRFIEPAFLKSNDLIGDFCQALSIDNTAMTRPASHLNKSPDGRILSFLNRHHKLFTSVHDHAPMTFLQQEKDRGDDFIGYGLTLEQFEKIQSFYESQNQELLTLFQPEMVGHAVIQQENAPIWEREAGFTPEEERSYLGEDLINRLFEVCRQ